MEELSDDIKKIEKEIQDDFIKTDKEISEFENRELKGMQKWGWLIGGIFLIIFGILLISSYFYYWNMLEFIFFGIIILISGIITIIFREFFLGLM
jgi:uncharacterized membrane protein HdeD (DUF308 family)